MADRENLGNLGRFSEPALYVLVSLAAGPKHGYAIIEDIEQMTGVRPGPGTLYGALNRLEQRGLIEPVASEERRKPYRLTSAGQAVLRRQLATLSKVVETGQARLAGA